MDSDRVKVIGIFGIIFLILCGYFYLTQGRKNVQQAKLMKQSAQQVQISDNVEASPTVSIEKKSGIYYKVHIAGEVVNPGVYSLDSKDRVIDAVEIAGGATEEADLDRVNLAEYIKDGEKIRIPNISERNSDASKLLGNYDFNSNKLENIQGSTKTGDYKLNSSPSPVVSLTPNELININEASATQLQQLPGVGPAIANSIVLYREENGSFESIEELKEVKRIGDKTFDKLKDFVTVD